MITALLSGVGMGFAVAIPVGPIGILCIKRSFARGRAAGLVTGLGAALADASYGVVVAAGISATGLLLSHAETLRIGGGLLIMALGLLSLWRFFTASPPISAPATGRGLLGMWFSTYLLTLSNPMTILAFVGMIAGLAGGEGSAFLLVVGVFVGSLIWWLILVQGVLLVKTKLPMAALRWLDLFSAILLLIWGGWIATGL